MKFAAGLRRGDVTNCDVFVKLYGQPDRDGEGSAGGAIRSDIQRAHLAPEQRAWDLLSIALTVAAADLAQPRKSSPDGWTRQFELETCVADPAFWQTRATNLESVLKFLTTDLWNIRFAPNGYIQELVHQPVQLDGDSVLLLSGGLDSLIGLIDRVAAGEKPVAVSKTVRGDAERQTNFARTVGDVRHFALNPNAHAPGDREDSQRARSFVFIALACLIATCLEKYQKGEQVALYLCENGFISINPPLTTNRIGSLSTRTAHPEYLSRLQRLIDSVGLGIRIVNPYVFKTKGEMILECKDAVQLKGLAGESTSCGRFQRFNYKHCGRCVPCQVRRAAFLLAGLPDSTEYVYGDLGKSDSDHAGFDDVRAVAMAIAEVKDEGLERWIASGLSSVAMHERDRYRDLLARGLKELAGLHDLYGVR